MKDKVDIFIICPVRRLTTEQEIEIIRYINTKEDAGLSVHWPPRDTNQSDTIGYNICNENMEGIREAKVIDVFWDVESFGSCFDLGIVFALNKPVRIIKIFGEEEVKGIFGGKSFVKVLKEHEKQSAWQLEGLNL